MDRRTFLNWVGVGILASSLPVAIAACQPQSSQPDSPSSEPEPDASTSSIEGGTVVGTVAALDEQGFLSSSPPFASGAIIVVRDPGNADTLLAVDSRCTHQGCSVEWNPDTSEYQCPCHQSAFAADGQVTNGPATAPLATFSAQIDGSNVVVIQPS